MSASSPARLVGRTIVITRAADQAAPLATMLADLGAVPLVVPLIEVVEPVDGGAELAAALEHLDAVDWLVVTSPNGASRVRWALAGTGDRPSIAAVGTATADALGVPADLVADVQTGAGLVAAFPLCTSGDGSVLVAQGDQAAPTVVDGLRAKGWTVTAVTAYRTRPVRPDAAMVERVEAADTVLFASGSAVRAWVEAFGVVTPPLAVAIGPATARVASEVGLKVHVVATDNSLHGLVAAVLSAPGPH